MVENEINNEYVNGFIDFFDCLENVFDIEVENLEKLSIDSYPVDSSEIDMSNMTDSIMDFAVDYTINGGGDFASKYSNIQTLMGKYTELIKTIGNETLFGLYYDLSISVKNELYEDAALCRDLILNY